MQVLQIQHVIYRNNKVEAMKILKSNILIGAVMAVASFATAAQAQDSLQKAYQSSNVKNALVNVCKEETNKGKKLTAAEVTKYCTCAVNADGKLTNDQKWQIQSAINQKKSPSTLAFVKKQNEELKTCFGPQLVTKLQKLTQEAQAAQAAQKKS